MGRTDSSSRRKHSKKKSLKVSSEGYRKKKSRRNKSKKLRHHEDSFSSRSDDESTSSSLNSSSSSEREYKRKRARSRSRIEIKGSKKRNRRSLSEDSEDTPPVKKRKRFNKGKKIKKKKSSKRDAYVSSASSDSESCSTCKDEDSSSDEAGRSRGRIGNRKSRSKTRRSVSPSISYGSESIEKVTVEINPMRLKSVITVANLENEEEDNMKNNELKEETVYDYDDYPSSKSNDSVELVDKKNVVKEVNSGPNLNDNIESEVDNLESILRQKALENLSRFRGGIKAKPAAPVDEKPKSDQGGVKQLKHETVSMIPVSQPVINRSRFTWKRDPSATTTKDEKAATYSGSQPAELKLQSANLYSTSRGVDNKFVNESSKIIPNTHNVDQKSTVVETSSSGAIQEDRSKEQQNESNDNLQSNIMANTDNVDQKSTVVETPSSGAIKEDGSKEQQNESKDNSQFEKKTMSVMRGGEMVQVSYKVYIPNRAPALARRKLKR